MARKRKHENCTEWAKSTDRDNDGGRVNEKGDRRPDGLKVDAMESDEFELEWQQWGGVGFQIRRWLGSLSHARARFALVTLTRPRTGRILMDCECG